MAIRLPIALVNKRTDLNLVGWLTGVEGAAINSVGLATLTDADPNATCALYTITVNWGDGKTGNGSCSGSGPFAITGSHTYADEGNFSLSVTVTDAGGSTGTVNLSAAISDAPLTVTVTPLTIPAGQPANQVQVGSFIDQGGKEALTHYSASIDWGDGVVNAGTIADGGAGFNVFGSHTYSTVGSYTLKLTVQDGTSPGSSAASGATAGGSPILNS